jgi:hypothetical protein
MKAQVLLNLALMVAIATPIAPVKAESVMVTTTTSTVTTTTQPGNLIPQTAGVVISLPGAITVDVGQKQDYPLTVPLAQPLLNLQGEEIIPANSPVSIKLKPENGGARIVAEAIVVRGQLVKIQAMTDVIPGNTITQQSGADRARENSGVFGNLFGAVMGAAAPEARKASAFDQGGMIGGAIGIVSGLTSPKNVRIVQLPQGSVYVLSLQAPIALPALASAKPPAPQADAPNQPQFDFKTVLDYSKGIENVITAFKQGQLSQAEARRLVIAADQYATTKLTPRLYPPAGLRKQVAQLFDFGYDIDRR